MKISRTEQIEQKYGVKLRRENTPHLSEGSSLNYVIKFPNGDESCEWLITLDDVEKYLQALKTLAHVLTLLPKELPDECEPILITMPKKESDAEILARIKRQRESDKNEGISVWKK